MSFLTGYNFPPGSRPWYLDSVIGSYKEATCQQVQIEVFRGTDSDILTTLEYRIVLPSGTVRTNENTLFKKDINGTLQRPPALPEHLTSYDHVPGDTVWVADRVASSVRHGTCYQVQIKIYSNVDDEAEKKTTYLVRYSDGSQNVRVENDDIFGDMESAWASLGIVIAPNPTPTPTGPHPDVLSSVILVNKVNSDSVALSKCTPVYLTPTGTISRVQNDINAYTFLGFVFDDVISEGESGLVVTHGVFSATAEEWQSVTEEGTALEEKLYYITSLGKIGTVAPLTGYSKQIGMGSSSVEFVINLMPTLYIGE